MKKLVFSLITLAIITGNLALEAAIAKPPHSDADIIAYGASVPGFKASVWLNPGCSASRVTLVENDPYDFYITAADCVNENPTQLDDEEIRLFGEFLKDGIFDLKSFTCQDVDTIEVRSHEKLQDLGNCELALKWHSCVRGAIDIGLIEACPSSAQEFFNLLIAHLHNTSPLGHDDMVIYEKLKCIIHPFYQEDDIGEHGEIDLALCTTYQKEPNLHKYKMKFIKSIAEIQDKKLISVSFGMRNTTDAISNMIPNRQAFNILVKSGEEPTELESIEDQEVSIDERPTGRCDSGDNGGTLLFEDNDGTYSLIAVTEAGSPGDATSHWTILDPKFIADAYEQLIKEAPIEIEKAEDSEKLDL